MAIKIAINHNTTYKYDRLVALSPHVFRLRPAAHSRTKIQSYSFKITPKEHFINWQQDPFGNFQARVVFPDKIHELRVEVEVIADLVTINPFDFFVEDYATTYPFTYSHLLQKELVPYLEIMEDGPELKAWLKTLEFKPDMTINDFMVYVNQKLNRDIGYSIRMEPGVQTCEQTLARAIGSCRDTSWLLVQIFRHLGIAARFVSGYLVQLTADVKSLDGPSGPENDFTDLHAWTEVYIPGAGWIGLDPTSGLFASEGHIPLACTPHYASAAPVVGYSDKCETEFEFSNIVTRIKEDPRVTKPYTEMEWEAIYATGLKVDDDLKSYGVKLTMGGEPTFVSIDDMESAQWNTAADGSHKRILAHDLIFRLRDKFAANGMLHYGQGKWYPGEPLPRWQYALYWRKDNYPIWKNQSLIAHEKTDKYYNYQDAETFIKELAKHLAVSDSNVSTAYEDTFYFLWTEGKTPVNVPISASNLKDPIERRTLAKLLDTGLANPAGFVLPLKWSYYKQAWQSCKWILNRDNLFLIPGNSPIGLRLPLQSLPVVAKAIEEEEKAERSLFEDLPALAPYHESINARYGTITDHTPPPQKTAPQASPTAEAAKKATGKPKKEEEGEKGPEIIYDIPTIKTALSVEARDGFLYIFMPPVDYLEHYLDLIASVEATAEKLSIPVRIEGYTPPGDYRLEKLVVSPDPGVIEVNIQPTKSWVELATLVDDLYELARLSRLGTEKFMLDGRHTGTGGGNHITIGGERPSESPLLIRPDLLRSFIGYWQHHPGLSYLFSGAFIGPTSQAPRFDEGLQDKIYEMEIAFDQVPESGSIPFWKTDRIFRHLLTDITGNTHRAEFCIDKMYSPDSSAGRLGILELRGFDMPPHKRMSLVQMLLIRALVAKFWNRPYRHKLVRWGTELHDRFLLPHFVKQDMKDVVADLNEAGYPFQENWFDPFFEFRFPHYGTVVVEGIEMEIRMGLEPWNVLGEEMSSTGTARFVDSSLERVQVKLSGFNNDRYILMCNGCRVPLTATDIKQEYVCGVRYRAWQPPSALHPTIGVDTPLTFDIVDTWNSRSIGGCTYYVSHPGGRSYDTFPINSYEAESRRVNRFGNTEHTQAILHRPPYFRVIQHYIEPKIGTTRVDPPPPLVNADFPFTLDMRKFWKK